MAAKKILFKKVDRHEFQDYFTKASEFHDTMNECFERGRWNSAALEAVHCAISANDALTIWSQGIKCSSPNHEDAVTLLQSLAGIKEVKEGANHLLRVIKKKNLVEYEGRKFAQKEAEEILLHGDRFFKWVSSLVL